MNRSKQGGMGIKAIVVLLVGLALASIRFADAQQPKKVPRIGLLRGGAPDLLVEAFRQGLRERGWVEGHNLTIEYRFVEKRDQLPILAADLVRLNVDVIFAPTFPAALAATKATGTIPIVCAGHADFVDAGLVTSLARPGGNVTGVTTSGIELMAKRLELLKEAVPSISRVAVLRNPANPVSAFAWRATEAGARSLGLQLQSLVVENPDDFEAALKTATREGSDALIVLPDPMVLGHLKRIAELAAKYRLPAMFEQGEFVDAGGLISYGANSPSVYRHAATYIDKILRGRKPADLPVERPMKFELVINLKTAKQIGVTIPQSVLFRADRVIK